MKNNITSIEVHINAVGVYHAYGLVTVWRGYNSETGFASRKTYGLRRGRHVTRASLLRCQRAQLALMERNR